MTRTTDEMNERIRVAAGRPPASDKRPTERAVSLADASNRIAELEARNADLEARLEALEGGR